MDALRLQYKAISKAGRGVRSLFSKAPKSVEVMTRLGWLLRRKLPGRATQHAGSPPKITIELHHAIKPVKIAATADGELLVSLPGASSVGPGYVQHVIELLDGILEEIDFVWDPASTGYATKRDKAALQREFVDWLRGQLPPIFEGKASRQLSIPQEPELLVEDAALLTPMGPRSRAWCERVLAGGDDGWAAAGESWPMWSSATAGALAFARALWVLWIEVPWRLAMGELEEGVQKQAHRELAAAYKLEPALPMPWAEWAELIDLLDLDDEVTDEVRSRGIDLVGTIGYRRHPARFQLTAGWSVALSPNFADAWEDDGATMIASDGDRTVRFSCAESEGDTGNQILAKIPMRGEVLARHDHDGYVGRVEGRDDDVNGIRLVTAAMALEGSVSVMSAVLRANRSDDNWAIGVWRTLERRVDEGEGDDELAGAGDHETERDDE